eukprot:CAMPEP_0115375522 /NCGR_PEP_ID=MMETSP0271-20121206/2504_1 /TAXON_ID=71861 /ORGANISM="Scrippsiella trochoidea, Strain CCMP3099" /LENGTH=92 /DNA_ID=CAMNT_0002798585 /DNA_START=88 /DNA_END=362 /DNA_ORIENTATION=+
MTILHGEGALAVCRRRHRDIDASTVSAFACVDPIASSTAPAPHALAPPKFSLSPVFKLACLLGCLLDQAGAHGSLRGRSVRELMPGCRASSG